MQEGAGEKSPPFAADRDTHRPHAPVTGDLIHPAEILQEEEGHVETDECVCHPRLDDVLATGDGRRRDAQARRTGDTTRALEANRRRNHALRANRPTAPSTGDVADPVWVPEAGRRGRLGLVGHWGASQW